MKTRTKTKRELEEGNKNLPPQKEARVMKEEDTKEDPKVDSTTSEESDFSSEDLDFNTDLFGDGDYTETAITLAQAGTPFTLVAGRVNATNLNNTPNFTPLNDGETRILPEETPLTNLVLLGVFDYLGEGDI